MNQPSPFDPLTIGPLQLRNRFIKSGANEAMCIDGAPTHALVQHHRALAAGGVGMTTVAYVAVSEEGRTLPNQIWMREAILPDLRVLTAAVHAEGAAISAQITHGGSFVTGIRVGHPTMSSVTGFNKAGLLAGNWWRRAMQAREMDLVEAQFVHTAELAREAGFDAVELHMGHGYLLNQFISPLDNRRRDEYGGSAENRARFPTRVLAAVKKAVGKDLAVIAKINVADGVPGGATADDAAVTARMLENAGADLLVLSGGRNVESTWFMFGSLVDQQEIGRVLQGQWLSRLALRLSSLMAPRHVEFRERYLRDYSMRVRAAVRMPLAYLGGVKSLDSAEAALADGFDCVVMARALIHDTALVNRFRSGETRHSGCTSCNRCIAWIYHPDGTRCVENPPNDPVLNRVRASASLRGAAAS